MEIKRLKTNENRNINLLNFKNELKKVRNNIIIITVLLLIILILIFLIIIFFVTDKTEINNIINKEIIEILLNKSNNDLKNDIYKYIDLKRHILDEYILKQNDFCNNPKKYYNEEIENEIRVTRVKLNDLYFDMYIYSGYDIVSRSILFNKNFEPTETMNILNALKYYKDKNNIRNNKDIYMLDIGGNIGWYPSVIGRFGYSILTFEPMEKNYYILKKNFCYINRYSNIIIINKGLSNKEKNCSYYTNVINTGNGMVLCDKIKNKKLRIEFQKTSEVSLTKLSNFIPYLYDKNIALIKIDIEGSEGEAIEGGIELITKYHVPFILLEFTPRALIEHGTNPKKFLNLFLENGYIIKINGFFNEENITIEEIMMKIKDLLNLYFVYG